MELSHDTTGSATTMTTSNSPSPRSQSPSLPPPPPERPVVVMSPCAACKILRRRCAEKCVLAPYFPPTEPAKFTIAHRVFGASNIIKLLQELPESHRADAVSSMVYEASARIRDPVYGTAGAICQLQKQVNELQAQLAKVQAELVNKQCQQAQLMALLCSMEFSQANNNHHQFQQQPPIHAPQQSPIDYISTPQNSLFEESNLGSIWEQPLWT